MASKMRLLCFLCAFIISTHRGVCEDVAMTCPAKWYDGNTVTLSCSVKKSQWVNGSPCTDSYSDNVDFKFTPNGQSAETTESTISNVHINCSSVPNANRCWCNESSTHFFLFCNVTADKSRYDEGTWKCQPDCVRISSPPLSVLKTKECEYTDFYDVCDGNPCSPGTCSENNKQALCNCNSTYYTTNGTNCKGDPCNGNSSSCSVQLVPGRLPVTVAIPVQAVSPVCICNCSCNMEIGVSVGGTVFMAICAAAAFYLYFLMLMITKKCPVKLPSSPSERTELQKKLESHLKSAGLLAEIRFQDGCIEIKQRNYWIRKTTAAFACSFVEQQFPKPPTSSG